MCSLLVISAAPLGLAVLAVVTAVLLHRGDPRAVLALTAGAALLACDAWFDVTTAATTSATWLAGVEAALVELPLAVPLILAGVRTALVLDVGTATLATFGGGGGLGDLITSGIVTQRMPVLVLGSVLTVALALAVDWLASLAEALLRPRGLGARA